MTVTQGVIDTIRKLLNESIPAGGTEADTHFTNAMLTEVISSATTQNHALYLLWIQKAGMVQAGDDVKQIRAGGEETVLYTKMEYVSMCKEAAALYKDAWVNESKTSSSCSMMSFRQRDCSVW